MLLSVVEGIDIDSTYAEFAAIWDSGQMLHTVRRTACPLLVRISEIKADLKTKDMEIKELRFAANDFRHVMRHFSYGAEDLNLEFRQGFIDRSIKEIKKVRRNPGVKPK